MKEFTGEISAEVKVCFESPEKAEDAFINSDWSDCFWDIDDLQDLASNITQALNCTPSYFRFNEKLNKHCYHCEPEGFGIWVREGDVWILNDEEAGKITVELPDVEAQYFTEVA